MKLAILVPACEKFEELYNFILPNKLEYCSRHNYDLLRSTRKYNGESIPFGKLDYIKEILPSYDWLWLLGADTIHMNMNISAEEFIDNDYKMVIGRDVNNINFDSCLLKNSPWTIEYITYILSQYDHYKHDKWQEQQCVIDSLDSNREHIKIIPQKSFNSYVYGWYGYKNQPGEFSDGDAILHFVGMQNNERIARMKEYLPRVIR